MEFVSIVKLTDMSENPAPDILSARSRSLSGSVRIFDVSDLFFKIDFERRCDSRFGDESMESIDSDNLFSVLPFTKKKKKKLVRLTRSRFRVK